MNLLMVKQAIKSTLFYFLIYICCQCSKACI